MIKKTIYISSRDNFWQPHTEDHFIGRPCILKSSALSTAVKHVASMQPDDFSEIKVQRKDGTYQIVWSCDKDSFPPGRIPLKRNKFMRIKNNSIA
jgi:hypothetical protein